MPTVAENQDYWARYDWKGQGDEWSVGAGGTPYVWHGTIMPRICQFVPTAHILEIACGHGRFSEYLLPLCARYTGIDLVPRCVEHCRARFADSSHATFTANDGYALPTVADSSVDFAFSWDSLVHVERDVMESYVLELARVLRRGGVAVLHHSNLGSHPDLFEPGAKPAQTTGWRGTTMTAAALREACTAAGLWCPVQEPRTFAGPRTIDCISVVVRPLSSAAPLPATFIHENAEFYRETHNLNRLGRLYAKPDERRAVSLT